MKYKTIKNFKNKLQNSDNNEFVDLLFSSSLISSLFKAPPCTLKLFLDALDKLS